MQDRIKVSEPSVSRLISFLKDKGFTVCRAGQENWLSPKLHEQIRYIHDNTTIDLIRYFPDLVVYRIDIGCFLVQAKSTTPKYYGGNNFSMETACLTIDKKLSDIGVRVLVVFENRPNEFYGEWANKIKPIYETTETGAFDGSRTPMSLVEKASVLELKDKEPVRVVKGSS